jgi:hypothetical protein
LPQSSGSEGVESAPSPRPVTTSVPFPSSSKVTPICANAFMVRTLSSPYEKPRTTERPPAKAEKITDRCPMLLSLGTGTLPVSGFVIGRTTKRDIIALRGST